MAELELTAQALRDTLREKEKEIEGTMNEMRKQQADRHRWLQRKYDKLIPDNNLIVFYLSFYCYVNKISVK